MKTRDKQVNRGQQMEKEKQAVEGQVMINHHNSEEKTNYSDKIFTFCKNATIIGGILAALYPVANEIYNMIYKVKCEEFYHIPGRYFENTINHSLLYLGLMVLIVLFFLYPIFLKRMGEKQEKVSKFMNGVSIYLAIAVGMIFGIFNFYNLLFIIFQVYNLNTVIRCICEWLICHPHIMCFIVVPMGCISIVGVALLHEIRRVKVQWLNTVILGLIAVSLCISILISLVSMAFLFSISPENKTKYEIITNMEEDYIVLTEYEDELLVVEYDLVDGQYILRTSAYRFLEKDTYIYDYINLKTSPVIGTD